MERVHKANLLVILACVLTMSATTNGHVIWNVNADNQRMRCVMGNADYCNDCPVFTGQ